MKRIVCVSAFVSLSMVLSGGIVFAQGGGAAAAPPAAPADQAAQDNGAAGVGDQLQEVVVTAERRATNLQTTPIAITAISGDQLQSLHLNSLSSLQTSVPGLQINDEGGGFYNFLNIRGIGATLASPTVQPGVALFRDGVLQGDSADNSTPLFDIRDTEVLKGPQGTLIGATSIGGAVEINSQDPNFNGLHGYALAGLGTYSDHHVQAAVNLPVSDTFAVRLALDYRNRHSFYSDIGSTNQGYYYKSYSATNPAADGAPVPMNNEYTTSRNSWDDPGQVDGTAVRVSFLWQPTSNFQVLNKASYYYNVTGGEPDEPNPATYNTLFSAGPGPVYGGCTVVPASTNFAGASGNQLVCPGAGVPTHSTYYYPGEKPYVLDYYNNEQWNELEEMEDLQLQYTFGNGIVVRSISGAIRVTGQYQNSISFGPQNAGSDHYWVGPNLGQYTEEVDVISPTTGPLFSKVNWQAGAFYEERDTSLDTDSEPEVSYPYQPGQLPSILSLFEISNVIRNQGVYGTINWQFTNTLQLQVGLRENWDEPYSNNLFAPAPAGATLPQPQGQGIYALIYPPGATSPAAYHVLVSEYNNLHYSASVPTGKVGLQWIPTPGQNFYLFWARGYKSGGANAATDYPTYTNETDDDLELGWKGTLFDGHMQTQVGGYYDRYRNMLYQIFDATGNNDTTTTAFNLLNLKPTTLYGLEAAEQSRIAGLGVDLAVDYSHSSLGGIRTLPNYALPAGFGSPLALPQCLPGHSYSAGTECFNYLPYNISVSGEQMPYSPTLTADASVDYQIRIGDAILDPRVTFHHTDKQYASLFENSYSELGVRNLLGAALDWIDGQWDVQLYGTNLTNQIYLVGTGGATVNYGDPRQIGFQFTRRF